MTASMKKITWCVNLPNKSKLHILQLHVVQKYMDIAYARCKCYKSSWQRLDATIKLKKCYM